MATISEAIVISSDLSQPSFSTGSSSDDETIFSSSDDEPVVVMPAPRRGNFTLRGPGVDGKERFDDTCIFANKMLLDRSNITTIKEMVRDLVGYPIKFYIYKLNPSSVNKTSKMEFGEKFTKTFLKQYLPPTNVSIKVRVSSPQHGRRYKVLMKLGLGKKKAVITTGWYKIVERYALSKDEVVCFHFWECNKGDLHLSIIHI